jgi:hypothetical protein
LGIFWNGKCWYILQPLGIFYIHLVWFMAIWYNLWSFSIFCGHMVYFSRFGMSRPRKVLQPWTGPEFAKLICWKKILCALAGRLFAQVAEFRAVKKQEPILRSLHLQLQHWHFNRLGCSF